MYSLRPCVSCPPLPPPSAGEHCGLADIAGRLAALHDLDPVFRPWSRSQKIARLLRDLGLRCIVPVQSMIIFKVIYCNFRRRKESLDI